MASGGIKDVFRALVIPHMEDALRQNPLGGSCAPPDSRVDRLLSRACERALLVRAGPAAIPSDLDHAIPAHPEATPVLGTLNRSFTAKHPNGPVRCLRAVRHAAAMEVVGQEFQRSVASAGPARDSMPREPRFVGMNSSARALALVPK